MANIPLQSITFPGLADKYTTPVVDNTLTQTGAAADAKKTGDEIAELKNDFNDLKSALTKITEGSTNLYNSSYELGTLNGSTGAESSSTTVIRTGFVRVEPDTSYIMYNMRDKYINMINPVQYIYEYDENKTFLRRSAVYVATFNTGTNTKYIRFLSNSYADMSDYVSEINSSNFQLNKGNLLLKYEPFSINTISHAEFNGVKSDNLYYGLFDIGGVISNGAWNYWGTSVAVITYPIEVSGADLYFLLDNSTDAFGLTYACCYKSDGTFISTVTASIQITSTATRIMHAALPTNTKYVYLSTPSYSRTSSDYATVKSMVEDHLIITEDFDYAWSRINTSGENKVNASLVNYGFHAAILNENIRDYIVSALETYADGIKSTGYDVVIPVMTDIHTLWHEPYAMLNWLSRCGVCDLVVNLGDNVPDHFPTKTETVNFLDNVFSISNSVPMGCSIVNIMGNHDTNPVNSTISDGTNMVKNNEFYSLSRERSVNEIVSCKNYGYVDIENAKIRVIILDTSDIYSANGTPLINGNNTLIQQEQLAWLYNVALNFSDKADASQWAVITMAHERLSTLATDDLFGKLFEAFSAGTSLIASATKTVDGYTETLAVDVDFTRQGAIPYICHINGHYHEDSVVTFGNGFNQITIGCDCAVSYYYVGGVRTAYIRTSGTAEEHLFDSLCVDKTGRKYYLKRFGIGSDREFSY